MVSLLVLLCYLLGCLIDHIGAGRAEGKHPAGKKEAAYTRTPSLQ